ncbi:kinesin-like protein KIN-14J [Herrania umbratica]|uniref:Kinesin-like protein KIN-14J n=1 Tax=Herrania umbratica TaxID=108875 RepID=A0A6J1BMR0_9ROSI|nr:kinesin-like protein KIN-14J [Herrania umbratica]XP_021300607.1 kinesin-like protein KIN-14J [Herrania umbratica]XP_021300608.1 kinesin-like protein KIN-14J [Herrania umbratica]XP_021300609.1 kinesin-like protein KIN-14J [Herrania umbratica]
MRENGTVNGLNGTHYVDTEEMESFESVISGDWLSSLVEWLNGMLPELSLPLDATEEELRGCLTDGAIFCTILNKLRPGSIEMEGGPVNVKRFLIAMDEMGLPSFELSDLEQGQMMPVLECLKTLRACFNFNGEADNVQNPSRKRWNLSGEIESIQLKQGCCADLSDATILELMKSSSLENASTQSLFSILYRIMDESIERKKGDVPHRVACLLRTIVQEIEWRVSTRAENLKNQNNVYRAREEKYQSRIRALETLAKGTVEENKVVISQLQHLKIEKSKLEEKGKVEEQDVLQLKKEKIQNDTEISRLREELESSKKMHEWHCLQLEAQVEDAKVELEKKLKELECLLRDSRKEVDELQSFSESKQKIWADKECTYESFIDQQFVALKELREASKSIKREVLKTKKSYSEELNYLGIKLKGLVDAAENYHSVLAENRRLYNEVQDLKGNIRVYCRIRPFLPGQSKKQTTIEYIGENGELVVSNPSKQGKDTHRLFKFNKVFSPVATQEEVFLDTQPLIRSVLDGYNVCIFAYGQTGSGKTYTMSGPNVSSKEDWGVNYRALNDLFQISQSRKSSIIYEVGVQMVEIYNEQVRDLLVGDSSHRRLGIWNTTQPNGLAVPEASMHSVKSTTDVLELMNIGLMNRAVGATALNERSSRSHSVLTVHVRGTDLKTNAVLRGSLHLVDLAGSERVDRSEATGDRLREAQHINKSLSALGDVIFALAQKNAHVPYRNSKLTQVLQSSLGGQAKTLMFVQLNPDVESYSETISTLKFAERVSGVELGAARTNREGRDIRELMEQVAFLKETITKKDVEIERLQLLKGNGNGSKHGVSSLRYGSSSPRGHSIGTPRESRSLSRRQSLGNFEKAVFDADNFSVNSDKRSEAGSHRTMDDSKLHNESSVQTNLAGKDLDQNFADDIELLGFGDADSEERLSDISDGGLSMGGTETDGSICSVVEFTLFPEVSKPSDKVEKVEKADKAEKPDNIEKSIAPFKLPKLPQKVVQTKPVRLSMSRSSSKASSSARKITAVATASSSTKPSKRWQ